jgi:PCO_ADO
MTPEMKRVVVEAAAAARDGWSDEAVKSLTKAASELRCDGEEVARLLALPVADHGFREEVLTTDPAFHASVFALAEGEMIPLHDHPAIEVISKVLCGRMRVHTYEWIDQASLVARDCGEAVFDADGDALVLRKSPGTLHMIAAVEPTAFLDLFAPYYDDKSRPCTYYEVAGANDRVQLRTVSWEEARQ